MKLARQIGPKELALIHLAKKELGLDEDQYRDVIECATGARSAKNLTYEQMDQLMNKFLKMGFNYKSKLKNSDNQKGHRQPYLQAPDRDPTALPSLAMMKRMEDLYEELGWGKDQQQKFNRRQTGNPWPQTRANTIKVIEGLKAIVKRKQTV